MLRLAVLSLLFGFPHLVDACGCVGVASKCDREWNSGETVFVGKTIAMERVSPPESAFLSSYAARFTVEERLRGADSLSAEVVVYTGAGGGDCGYPFVPGTSYLVYASRIGGDSRLHAGVCSETKPAVMAGGVLNELRAVRDHRQPDMIFGTIGMAPRVQGLMTWWTADLWTTSLCVPLTFMADRFQRKRTIMAYTRSLSCRRAPTRSNRICHLGSQGPPSRLQPR